MSQLRTSACLLGARLPPGRYQVVWRSPATITVTDSGQDEEQNSAPPMSVTISARRTASITLVGVVP